MKAIRVLILAAIPFFIWSAAAPRLQAGDTASTVLSNAVAAAKRGNAAEAENEVLRLNRRRAGTPEWHLESAHRLYRLAFLVAGQGGAGQDWGRRALAHVTEAQRQGLAETAQQGEAWELAGRIYEELLGDWPNAAECYQRSVAADSARVTAQRKLKQMSKAAKGGAS